MSIRTALAAILNVTVRNMRGEPCTVGGQSCNGIFDMAAVQVDAGNGEVSQSALAPVLDVALADLITPPTTAMFVTIAGISYNIVDIQKDGNGAARLLLQRVTV